jgi:hypothetical protein
VGPDGVARPTLSDDVALVPQAKPLFVGLTAADRLTLAAGLNRGRWDADVAAPLLQRRDV